MIERLSVSLGELDLWYNPRDAKGLLTNPSMNMSTLHNSIQTCLVLEASIQAPMNEEVFKGNAYAQAFSLNPTEAARQAA